MRAKLSPELWLQRVVKARQRSEQVEAVLAEAGGGPVGREMVRRLAPGVAWPTFLNWLRCYEAREGPGWERLLDLRYATPAWETPAAWAAAVKALGLHEPRPSFEKMREMLTRLFGSEARLGDKTLRKILREAGLWEEEIGRAHV